MASATINAILPTKLCACASPERAIICDVCRKHCDIPTTPCRSLAEESPSTLKVHGDSGLFDCSICLDVCHNPVLTLCGHLFCWPCLYYWLSLHSVSKECPVCKSNVQDKIVPLYGHGTTEHSKNSAAMMFPDIEIPCRPLPSRSNAHAPVLTNTIIDGERNDAIQDSEIHTMRVRQAVLSAPYSDGFFCARARNGTSILERQQSLRDERVHSAFIVAAIIAIVCFSVC